MHYLGMIGQPRRTHSYNEGHGFETWNQIATIGALILGVGIAIGVYQFFSAFFNKKLKPLTSNKKEDELLIEMIFQLGITGCLKFKNLLKNMRKGNKHLVCFEMMESLWYKQTPYRVKTLIKTFLNNEQ